MSKSFKDWIASIRKAEGRMKRFQEDILSDDGFPDTDNYNEMRSYLKKNNASAHIMIVFAGCYKQYSSRVLKRKSHLELPRKDYEKGGVRNGKNKKPCSYG